MDVGIGLPSTIPGTRGKDVLDWARLAEDAGFSTLGTLDRVVYDNYDAVPVLAAAAAVTSRIRLTTAILIAPYRGNGAVLAKQLASVDRLSGGRLTAGIAVGGREDDYTATDVPFRERGRLQDQLLDRMAAIWAGEPTNGTGAIGPAPATSGGPRLLLGGTGAATFRRVGSNGAGWIAGGGGVEAFSSGAEQARAAWADAGREGRPRLVALGYFALGDGAETAARNYLHDYYGFLGEYAEMVAASALTDAEAVRQAVDAFTDADCDELILFPCAADPGQVDLLAEALRTTTTGR